MYASCRTYVCFDVLRRVLTRVFGLRVVVAMGITDIDDKIINQGMLHVPAEARLAAAVCVLQCST